MPTTHRKPISECQGVYPDIDWVYTGGVNLWVMGSAPDSNTEVKVNKVGATKFAISSHRINRLIKNR